MKILMLCFLLPATIVYATSDTHSHESFVGVYGEMFQWFLGISITAIGFFLQRTLNTMDKNNAHQWRAIGKLDSRLSTLEGEHNAIHLQPGGRRHYDPKDQ